MLHAWPPHPPPNICPYPQFQIPRNNPGCVAPVTPCEGAEQVISGSFTRRDVVVLNIFSACAIKYTTSILITLRLDWVNEQIVPRVAIICCMLGFMYRHWSKDVPHSMKIRDILHPTTRGLNTPQLRDDTHPPPTYSRVFFSRMFNVF